MKKYVSWRRVSTKKQSKTGLGLAAQKEIIRYFIERDEGEWIADYEECYTGTDINGCVELKKAMEHAKKEDAVLIIAKSDRFRNTIEALQVYDAMGDGHIMFCDLPHTDKFTLTLFFALAEREALIVSIRTKQALDAKRARGEKVGGACEAWHESFENKTKEQKTEEYKKRAASRSSRHVETREVQAFLRILKNVFTDACTEENPALWKWDDINTKGERKFKVIQLMKDYKSLDENGTLFSNWDFSLDSKRLQVRLSSSIKNVRRSFNSITRNS